jgi:hypothetical protein
MLAHLLKRNCTPLGTACNSCKLEVVQIWEPLNFEIINQRGKGCSVPEYVQIFGFEFSTSSLSKIILFEKFQVS